MLCMKHNWGLKKIRAALCLVIQTDTHKQKKKKVEKSCMLFPMAITVSLRKILFQLHTREAVLWWNFQSLWLGLYDVVVHYIQQVGKTFPVPRSLCPSQFSVVTVPIPLLLDLHVMSGLFRNFLYSLLLLPPWTHSELLSHTLFHIF